MFRVSIASMASYIYIQWIPFSELHRIPTVPDFVIALGIKFCVGCLPQQRDVGTGASHAHRWPTSTSGDLEASWEKSSGKVVPELRASPLALTFKEAQNHPRNHAIHAISSEKHLGWMIGTVWTLLNHVKHRMPWPLQCIVCWWAKILPRWISWDFQATDVRMKDVRVCKYLEVSHEKVI